jgi:hypothetical protein
MIIVPTDVALGELASRLRADESGDLQREYSALFDKAQGDARRRLYEPLTTEEHEATLALAEGTRHCTDVINAVWHALHP